MKKLHLSLLILPLFFFFAPLTYADHNVDFHVTGFQSTDTATPLLSVGSESVGSNGDPCVLVDNSNNSIVDNNAQLINVGEFSSQISLSIATGTMPTGWTPSSAYHLECTIGENITVDSNDFAYMVAPTIVYSNQNANIIDIYFSPILTKPAVPSTYNPSILLASPDWFDNLGTDGATSCEDNVIYNSQMLSVCHFDLNANPALPSTNNATFFNSAYIDNASSETIFYAVKSTNTLSVTTLKPQINQLSGATINRGGTYSENGAFSDIDSTSWTATVDYGDGSGVQPLSLNSDKIFSLSHQYTVTGTYTVTVNITDNQENTGTATATVTVNNVNVVPAVGAISFSTNPVQSNHSSVATASFTDANTSDTHTAVWNWGDGSTTNGTVTESNGSGSVSDSHTYTTAGSHTVILTVTDTTNLSGTSQYVVAVSPTNTFTGANLSHLIYNGANFSNVDLTKTNGTNAQFENVNFSSATLTQSNFSNSNLSGSNFTGANLTKANFSNTNLTNANFTGANLTQANLSNSIRTGIIWSNTICPNGQNSNNHNNSCSGQGGGL